MTADEVVELLGLEPLPGEGGWFRETYKASGTIPAEALPGHGGARAFSTQIYYLLRSGSASKLHRVKSDEVFHHYLGDSVSQVRLDIEGRVNVVEIGGDLRAGQRPQVVVPAGWWQGAVLSSEVGVATGSEGGAGWALMGCTVAPGFEWDDFELIDPERDAAVVERVRSAVAWADRVL
ncbi:MAG: cupin domain-containing protein [Planctomycetota bacterium]